MWNFIDKTAWIWISEQGGCSIKFEANDYGLKLKTNLFWTDLIVHNTKRNFYHELIIWANKLKLVNEIKVDYIHWKFIWIYK